MISDQKEDFHHILFEILDQMHKCLLVTNKHEYFFQYSNLQLNQQ